MLKLNRQKVVAEDKPLNLLRSLIATKASQLRDESNSIVGTESLSSNDFDTLNSAHDSITNQLTTSLSGVGNESASAMAEALMVCSNTTALAEAMTGKLGLTVGNESFASDSIVENLHLTVGVAGELAQGLTDAGFIFPKVVVDQATTNYKISAIRTVVEPKFYHAADGNITDWSKLNLLDAAIRDGFLRKDLNVLVPELVSGREALFVSDDYVTPWEVTRSDGKVVSTSFLGGTADINLISNSTARGMDRSTENTILDRIDEGSKIKGLIIGIGDPSAPKAAYLSTLAANHSTFTRSDTESEGNGRNVAFGKTVMMINLDTYTPPAAGGMPELADIPELKALKDAGYSKVGFKVANSYELDLSDGTFSTTSQSPQVVYLEKAAEKGINVYETAKVSDAALLTAIKAIFLGTDWAGTLSNATLKMDGDKLGTQSLDKLYPLNVRTPIEIRKDVLSAGEDADAIRMISQALSFRRDDETVDELHKWFNWAEANLGHEGVHDSARKDLDIIGLHYFLKPYVKRVPIDLDELLKEEDTTGKLQVLEVGLVTRMMDELLSMFKETNYRSVARTHGSDPKFVPEVGLYGDSRVTNYIMRTGEDRTFGDGVTIQEKPVIHPTDRESMTDVVYAMPRASDYQSKEDRIFGFGHAIEITPIVVKRARDNGVAHDQVQVWPVYTNIVTTPMLIRFEIKGLREYFAKASADKVATV